MSRKADRSYTYLLGEPLKRSGKRRSFIGLFLAAVLVLVPAGGAYHLLSSRPELRARVISALPIPHELQSVTVLRNGEKLVLRPGAQPEMNPADTIQLVDMETDGWFSFGTWLESESLSVDAISIEPLPLQAFLPEDPLLRPKRFQIRAYWWYEPIGEVSFAVRLNARDWLRKALAASDPARKKRFLEEALEEDPQNILLKNQLAAACAETGDYDAAVVLYRELLEKGESKPLLERLLSVYKHQDRVDRALSVYPRILELSRDPKDFQEFLHYLNSHKKGGDLGEFVYENREAIPERFYNSLLVLVAEHHVKQEEWDRAAAAYERALRAGLESPNLMYNLSVAYEKAGRIAQATAILERYLRKSPDDPETLVRLAELEKRIGNRETARRIYQTILINQPDDESTLLRLIDLLQKMGNQKELAQAYDRLAELRPQDETVHFNQGVLHYELGNWDRAAEAFRQAASLDPEDVESRKYLLDLYQKQGTQDAQERMLKELIGIEPNRLEYYEALFALYDRVDNYSSIISFFGKAARQHPNWASLRKYVLYAALKNNDKGLALEQLEQLIQIQPKNKKYLRQAARLYEDQKNYEEAIEKMKRLLELSPEDTETENEYLRLRNLMLSNNSR